MPKERIFTKRFIDEEIKPLIEAKFSRTYPSVLKSVLYYMERVTVSSTTSSSQYGSIDSTDSCVHAPQGDDDPTPKQQQAGHRKTNNVHQTKASFPKPLDDTLNSFLIYLQAVKNWLSEEAALKKSKNVELQLDLLDSIKHECLQVVHSFDDPSIKQALTDTINTCNDNISRESLKLFTNSLYACCCTSVTVLTAPLWIGTCVCISCFDICTHANLDPCPSPCVSEYEPCCLPSFIIKLFNDAKVNRERIQQNKLERDILSDKSVPASFTMSRS